MHVACQHLGRTAGEDIPEFFTRHVFHCGVLERSADFETGLSGKLGRPFSLPHDNRAGTRRQQITPVQRTKLEQIYARDLKLYEW